MKRAREALSTCTMNPESFPKALNRITRNKQLITKSSMMGVLGVVPEENDSEGEDGQLRERNFKFVDNSISKRLLTGAKEWCSKFIENRVFPLLNGIIQSIYIIIGIIYFYLSYFADRDNLYSLIIILLLSTISILIVYGIIVFSKGCRSLNGVEFWFLSLMTTLELIEVIVRTSIDYEAK